MPGTWFGRVSERVDGEEFGIGLARAMGRSISFPPVSSLSFFVPPGAPVPVFALQIHLHRGFSRFIKFAFSSRRTPLLRQVLDRHHECTPAFEHSFPARKGCIKNFNLAGRKLCRRGRNRFSRERASKLDITALITDRRERCVRLISTRVSCDCFIRSQTTLYAMLLVNNSI